MVGVELNLDFLVQPQFLILMKLIRSITFQQKSFSNLGKPKWFCVLYFNQTEE